MKNIILDIIHTNNDYTGNGMYMALYLVTLLFIFFIIKDDRLKRRVAYPQMVLLFFVYVGVNLMNYVMAGFASQFDQDVKGRFVWVFMIPAIAAMGCTMLVDSVKEKKNQIMLTIAFVPVIFMCGVFQITDYRFQKAENLYKIPQVFIDMSDDMLERERQRESDGMEAPAYMGNREETVTTGLGDMDNTVARVIVPYEAAYAFRQYTAHIELMYGEDATFGRIYPVYDDRRDVCNTMQTSCPDLDLILKSGQRYAMEYILFDCTYVDFGLKSINDGGYTEDENFVGDRTPDPDVLRRTRISGKVNVASMPATDGGRGNEYWDLSAYGLEYMGTYGRYLLYRFV